MLRVGWAANIHNNKSIGSSFLLHCYTALHILLQSRMPTLQAVTFLAQERVIPLPKNPRSEVVRDAFSFALLALSAWPAVWIYLFVGEQYFVIRGLCQGYRHVPSNDCWGER